MTMLECSLGCNPYFYNNKKYFNYLWIISVKTEELIYFDLLNLIRDKPAPIVPSNMFSKEFEDFISSW